MKRDLPKMIDPSITAQQLFDYITHFLYKQGKASMGVAEDGTETCAYRGSKGLMCAVGCIIPDEIYVPLMEAKAVDELGKFITAPKHKSYKKLLEKHISLLCELQTVHDDLYDYEYIGSTKRQVRQVLLKEFAFVAEDHGLEFDPKDYKAR